MLQYIKHFTNEFRFECYQEFVSLWLKFKAHFRSYGIFYCITFQELLQLEEDAKLLDEMYPQGEKVKD